MAHDKQFLGAARRILGEVLPDGMRRNLDIGECKSVAHDAAPARCAKFDNRHAAHYTDHIGAVDRNAPRFVIESQNPDVVDSVQPFSKSIRTP